MFNSVAYLMFITWPSFEGQFNEVSRNDKNYIFREFENSLTIEEAAKLCLKTVRTVKQWDNGKSILPECSDLWEWIRAGNLVRVKIGKTSS